MTDKTQQALDRMDAALDRSARKRPRGFSTAPFVFGAALILGYQLLVRLVPRIWANVLPGGFDQGQFFRGWPRLVWQSAWFCTLRFPAVLITFVVLFAIAVAFGRNPWTRPIAWLLAVCAILLNAAILIIALKAGMDANGVGQILN